MDKLWRGAFANPIMKHYRHDKAPGERHPEELPEHINIVSVTQLTDDEVGYYESMLEILGDSGIPWLVEMSFVADSGTYEFVVYLKNKPDAARLKSMLADYFTPQ